MTGGEGFRMTRFCDSPPPMDDGGAVMHTTGHLWAGDSYARAEQDRLQRAQYDRLRRAPSVCQEVKASE